MNKRYVFQAEASFPRMSTYLWGNSFTFAFDLPLGDCDLAGDLAAALDGDLVVVILTSTLGAEAFLEDFSDLTTSTCGIAVSAVGLVLVPSKASVSRCLSA